MALGIYQNTITLNNSGQSVPSAVVQINNTGSNGTGLATLWQDRAGTVSAGNPVTADANGKVAVYLEPSRYKITVTAPGGSAIYEDVEIVKNDLSQIGSTQSGNLIEDTGNWLDNQTVHDYSDISALDASLIYDGYPITTTKSGLIKKFIARKSTAHGLANLSLNANNNLIVVIDIDTYAEGETDSLPNIKWWDVDTTGATNMSAKFDFAIQQIENQAIKNGAQGAHGEIFLPRGFIQVRSVSTTSTSISGRATLKAKSDATQMLYLGREQGGFWYRTLKGIDFDGQKVSNGVSFRDNEGSFDRNSGRWVLDQVRFYDCNRAIEKLYGNISNTFNQVSVRNCNYGYWAQGVAGMHPGADTFNQGHYSGCELAAFYITDIALNGGQHVWNETIIEGNQGFGVFVKDYTTLNIPLTFNSVWCEGNTTSPSVEIEGTVYSTKDFRFENVQLVRMIACKFTSMEIIKSSVILDSCWLQLEKEFLIDSESSVIVENAWFDRWGGHPEIIINSICDFTQSQGGNAATFPTSQRAPILGSPPFGGTVAFSDTGDTAYTYSGTGTVASTVESDGLIYNQCQQLVVPAGFSLLHPTTFTVTAGLYYVSIFEIKRPVGDNFTVSIQNSATLVGSIQSSAIANEWTTVLSVSQATDTSTSYRVRYSNMEASSITIRTGAVQVLAFTRKADAISFVNSRAILNA